MATDEKKERFLDRWSRVKRESVEEKKEESPKPSLPPVDKLTPESDFSAFMHPKVEDALRRAALKKLFSDPHFNLPDPYEPYSRDWNIAEPISDEMLATLNQARTLIFGDKEKAEEKKEQHALQPAPETEAKSDEPGKQDA